MNSHNIPYEEFQQNKTQQNSYDPLEENDPYLNILFHENDVLNNNCDYFSVPTFNSAFENHSTQLTFMNANIRSVSKNFEKLELCTNNIKIDFTIRSIAETWLKEVNLQQYYSMKMMY